MERSRTKIKEVEGEYIESNGLLIRCPVCGAVWTKDYEGEISLGDCKHLRFMWDDLNREISFYGDWDTESFSELIDTWENELENEETQEIFDDYFKRIERSDIDEIIEHSWTEDPIVQMTCYWGYKKQLS